MTTTATVTCPYCGDIVMHIALENWRPYQQLLEYADDHPANCPKRCPHCSGSKKRHARTCGQHECHQAWRKQQHDDRVDTLRQLLFRTDPDTAASQCGWADAATAAKWLRTHGEPELAEQMLPSTCSRPSCDRDRRARGLCEAHYRQHRKALR